MERLVTCNSAVPERSVGRGRPIEFDDDQSVPDGVLWVLRTGAAYAELADRYQRIGPAFAASANVPKHQRVL